MIRCSITYLDSCRDTTPRLNKVKEGLSYAPSSAPAFHFFPTAQVSGRYRRGATRFSQAKIRDLPDFIAGVFGLCLGIFLGRLGAYFMKVLLTDDRRGNRDSLRRLVQREPEVQVSGIAEDAENAPAV